MLYQQESVSAMFQINAGRGAHPPARQSAALARRPVICFVNGSIARPPREDGAYHASRGRLSVNHGLGRWRRDIPPSHLCTGAPGETKGSPAPSTHEGEKQRVILLIAHGNCHCQGQEWDKWCVILLQSTFPTGMLGTPRDSGTSLFL